MILHVLDGLVVIHGDSAVEVGGGREIVDSRVAPSLVVDQVVNAGQLDVTTEVGLVLTALLTLIDDRHGLRDLRTMPGISGVYLLG